MSLVNMVVSISIVATCILASMQTMTNMFKANATSQVKTDIDTFVFNAQGVANIQPSCPTSQFCYIHDAINNGQTFMVFQIKTPIYGGQIIQRLKPTYVASNGNNGGGSTGNNNGSTNNNNGNTTKNNSGGDHDDSPCDNNNNGHDH